MVGGCCFCFIAANRLPLKFRFNQGAVREIRFTKRCAENDVAGWVDSRDAFVVAHFACLLALAGLMTVTVTDV